VPARETVPARVARRAGSDVVSAPPIAHSRPWISAGDRRAVDAALASEMIAGGARVAALERAIADRLGAAGAVATGSGSDGIVLALRALAVAPGDEVVIPTYVCRDVEDAVRRAGARPVHCDIGPGWNATPESVAARVGERTAALILVHTFGIALDPAPFRRLGVPIVEDACQAFGAMAGRVPAGAAGDLGVLSFHATKCLSSGEGGMVCARGADLAARLRALADDRAAGARMSDLQAALGASQLARYDEFLARRRHIAERYLDALPADLTRALARERGASMLFRFPLRVGGDFETLKAAFADRGVAVRRGVDALLHRRAQGADADFPNACRAFRETLSIPLYPVLSDEERDRVIAACTDILRAGH